MWPTGLTLVTFFVCKSQAENKDLKDKVLYTLAEMENVRTIARRSVWIFAYVFICV